MATRRAEADEFYAEQTPAGASADEAMVLRQACACVSPWGKQLYYYAVSRWLDGATRLAAEPLPAPAQGRAERPVAQLRRVRHHLDADK